MRLCWSKSARSWPRGKNPFEPIGRNEPASEVWILTSQCKVSNELFSQIAGNQLPHCIQFCENIVRTGKATVAFFATSISAKVRA